MKKEVINLKENGDVHIGGLRGTKGKGQMWLISKIDKRKINDVGFTVGGNSRCFSIESLIIRATRQPKVGQICLMIFFIKINKHD